jgi:hypothetical protein
MKCQFSLDTKECVVRFQNRMHYDLQKHCLLKQFEDHGLSAGVLGLQSVRENSSALAMHL